MHRARLFILWLMMFAVPFQAYAAASMVFCGPGPGHAGAVTAGVNDRTAHPHADGRADTHHDAAQDAEPIAKDNAGKTASAEPDAMHKCGTCGACHATALTSTPQRAVFHDLPRADLMALAITVATLAPRVLDKPPRV